MDKDNQLLFKSFENKMVKVVYKEVDGLLIGKGLLKEISSDFILIEGNNSIQLIPISSIIKLNCSRGDYLA